MKSIDKEINTLLYITSSTGRVLMPVQTVAHEAVYTVLSKIDGGRG